MLVWGRNCPGKRGVRMASTIDKAFRKGKRAAIAVRVLKMSEVVSAFAHSSVDYTRRAAIRLGTVEQGQALRLACNFTGFPDPSFGVFRFRRYFLPL